ncbi:hypothetical protein [Evansella cellulosilytica]|uniref:Uncharacterized protein n=1 Tax=Evansella cellulosilytica (strain ATCC 21833 / DSM 2522 / FERM P-1141 / JCM 9156 / N-4) TaxID=649639 RepID=E6TQS7_EVAC2|nr:hypothetical protein [Evansella cellulosilytica]ADU31702.1 hypothetical protein Bcell_3460 [Evansella cellulosilytica DSM 2522]
MKPVRKNDDLYIKEAFRGLTWGLLMMIVVFLILHFVFDIKAFQ